MEYNLTMGSREVRTIAIRSRHAQSGALLSHAPGNEFIVKNSDPAAIAATIVTNVAGLPAVRLQPIADEVEGVEIDVLDTVGSKAIELTVKVESRDFTAELELDMENANSEQQGQPSEAVTKPKPGPNETKPVGSTATIDPGVAVGGPAVVGPEKGDGAETTAEPGAVTQPGAARQAPAGDVSTQEREQERQRREDAEAGRPASGTTGGGASVAHQEADEKERQAHEEDERVRRQQQQNAGADAGVGTGTGAAANAGAIHEGDRVQLNKDHPAV